MSQSEAQSSSDTPRAGETGFAAVSLRTGHTSAEVLSIVAGMSKKGKLPGFVSGGEGLFSAAAFGKPFDSELVFTAEDSGEGCVLTGRVRMKRVLPTVFGVVVALTIWPGVLLTDSVMNTWFGWYPNEMWVTYAWYMPVTIVPLPWMVRKAVRQSQASAAEHARETVEKIAGAVGGTVVEND